MKLVLPELNYDGGFTAKNDIFMRGQLREQLESIIRSSDDDNLVLAIDDAWGNGKTTFLKLWEKQIEKEKPNDLKMVYFDAFKNDHQEDAFIALSSAIYPVIEDDENKKNFVKAAKKAGVFLLKTAAKVGVSALTLGVVKDTELEDIGDEIKGSLTEPLEKFIQERLENAHMEDAIIQKFKNAIAKAAEDKKIIFIIDELDRARPDFSLDLIEKIKHIFNSKNIFFILSMNKSQFLHIIKKRYGDIDAETYLGKFVHFWFALPKPLYEDNKPQTFSIFFNHMFRVLPLKGGFQKSLEYLEYFLTSNNCSLRDAERCYSTMLLVSASGEHPDDPHQVACAILTYLKIKSPALFEKIVHGQAAVTEVEEALMNFQLPDKKRMYISSLLNTDFLSERQLYDESNKDIRIITRNGERVRAINESLPLFKNVITK